MSQAGGVGVAGGLAAARVPGLPLRWADFRSVLLRFAQQPRERRAQLLFRGQANSQWFLTTTLDRVRSFASDADRNRFVQELLEEFRREAAVLRSLEEVLPVNEALELLARHHGLPSPLLDWSESPYIAAYFAYQGCTPAQPARVWTLDRTLIPGLTPPRPDFDLIDNRLLLQFNRRALQQRGSFVRVNSARLPVEQLLAAALFPFDLDPADRALALADLDVMNINSTTLFDDLDGVAQTVVARMF